MAPPLIFSKNTQLEIPAKITSARTFSGRGRPGSPPPELLAAQGNRVFPI